MALDRAGRMPATPTGCKPVSRGPNLVEEADEAEGFFVGEGTGFHLIHDVGEGKLAGGIGEGEAAAGSGVTEGAGAEAIDLTGFLAIFVDGIAHDAGGEGDGGLEDGVGLLA